MAVTYYNPRTLTIAWAGYSFQDLTPEDFLTLTFNSDLTESESGGDGGIVTTSLPDESGLAVVKFQQGSASDIILSGVVAAQKLSGRPVVASMIVSDPAGSTLTALRNAHIQSRPETVYGSTASGKERAYTFFVEEMISLSVPAGLDQNSTQVVSAVATISEFIA